MVVASGVRTREVSLMPFGNVGTIIRMKSEDSKVTPSMLFPLGLQLAAFGPGVHETSQQGSEHHPGYCQG